MGLLTIEGAATELLITSLGHDDPYRPMSVAKPAAFPLHELSRTSTLQALGYDLEFGVGGISHLAGSFLDDFGAVILSQP